MDVISVFELKPRPDLPSFLEDADITTFGSGTDKGNAYAATLVPSLARLTLLVDNIFD